MAAIVAAPDAPRRPRPHAAGQPGQAASHHARPQDVTEGYAADWTMAQLRDAAQRIADKIDEKIRAGMPEAGLTDNGGRYGR